MALRLFFLSRLLTPSSPSSRPPPESLPDAEHGQPDVINSASEDRPSNSGHVSDEDEGNEQDNDDADADDEDDEDDEDPLPWSQRVRRRLSISRTFTTFSSNGRLSSLTWPPAWLRKVAAFFLPPQRHDHDYFPHYRHTPILSGIIIPFSILLEIPGLTEHWSVRTDQGKTVDTQKNSIILYVGLGFSMLCAVIANVCLVVRFIEIRVKTMTVLCVVFLTVHDVINIVILVVFGIVHSNRDGFTYGQAFWMTVCSTIASFVTNITLIVDLIRTPDFSKSGSGLTRRQRTLVVVVILLLTYIAFGALINSFLEHLSFIDALYFTIVTIETIGFGDIVPNSAGSRVFICIYASFGILNLALLVGMMRETVLEALEVSYRKRLKTVRAQRRATRRRRRSEVLWREAVEWRLGAVGAPIWVKDNFKSSITAEITDIVILALNWIRSPVPGYSKPYRRGLGYGHGQHPHGMHLNLEALTRAQLEAAAMEAGVPLATLLPAGFRSFADADDQDGDSSRSSRRAGEAIVAGITGLWRERRTRDERDVEGQQIPTHARLGRMVAMLGNFAMALHKSSMQTPAQSPALISRELPSPESSSTGRNNDFCEKDQDVDTDGEIADVPKLEDDGNQSAIGILADQNPNNILPSGQPSIPNANMSTTPHQYESYRLEMENEEKRAFFARVTVAWILFLVFWTIGSGIFMRTEKWSYWTALYFCFITFTTIGFGDRSPQTPAGRSVFVVWALLGVATMTILISVLSEAYSSRYKNVLLHTHVFKNAVKRYRLRTRLQPPSSHPHHPHHPHPHPHHRHHHHTNLNASYSSHSVYHSHSPSLASYDFKAHSISSTSLSNSPARVQQLLEALPKEILSRTRTFHEQVQYLIKLGSSAKRKRGKQKDVFASMPGGLRELLSEITEPDVIGEQIKEEILHDDDVRKTLLALSIEKELRGIVEAAEKVLDVVEQRDNPASPYYHSFTHEHVHDEHGTDQPTGQSGLIKIAVEQE